MFKSHVDTLVENKQRQNVRTNKDDLFVKILCTDLCSNLLHSFFAAQVLRAHKLFLSACSPWFQKVLITILIRPHSICADMSSLHYDAQCHNTQQSTSYLMINASQDSCCAFNPWSKQTHSTIQLVFQNRFTRFPVLDVPFLVPGDFDSSSWT